jgi:hypothetical protein
MSKKLLLSLSLMAGVMFVAVSPALATPPNCSTGRNATQYSTGRTIGASIARQAWLSVGQEPDRFEEAADAVREAISNAILGLPNTASDAVKCRAKGMSQGVCDQLGDIQDEVAGICLLDGQLWGTLSGDLYCALAIEFGAVDAFELAPIPPTNLCGENFVEGCEDHFASYASSLAACVPFTIAPNEVEFASWQGGMCSYEIP